MTEKTKVTSDFINMLNISEKEGNFLEFEFTNTASQNMYVFMIDKDLFDLALEERHIFDYDFETLKVLNKERKEERENRKKKAVGMMHG